jgi:hypothetical protein
VQRLLQSCPAKLVSSFVGNREVSKKLVDIMPPINLDLAVQQTERITQKIKQAIKPNEAN